MKKDLTQINDLNMDDVATIIKKAFEFKENSVQPISNGLDCKLQGKVVAIILEKPSLRTRVAFEIAVQHFGATPIILTSNQILSSGQNEAGRESIPDIAKNLERFCDLIIVRTYSHATIQQIAANTNKPVINALCDQHHPTQALADLMTIIWHKKEHQGLKIAFIGDGTNVATSLMHIAALAGINFSIASPCGYEIPPQQIEIAKKLAFKSNTKFKFLESPELAVKNADIIYTDTFVSMGQEAEKIKRLQAFQGYQVTMTLLKKAKANALFMHCLPAHRGEEVTDEVMDCSQSIVFDQAESRLHIAKALISTYLLP